MVKESIQEISKTKNELKCNLNKVQECLDMLQKYVKIVESGKKWNHKMYKINKDDNNSIQTQKNEENKERNTNENDNTHVKINNTINDWKYKELWENTVLQAFNVANNNETPDLWLHILIEYCHINSVHVLTLS